MAGLASTERHRNADAELGATLGKGVNTGHAPLVAEILGPATLGGFRIELSLRSSGRNVAGAVMAAGAMSDNAAGAAGSARVDRSEETTAPYPQHAAPQPTPYKPLHI